MCKCIKKILFQYFIQSLYRKYEPFYFPIMAKAPNYLNYAYPDFSVQYYVTTFAGNQTVTIKGKIPKYKINFFSFTLYEKNGLPYYSKNDDNIHVTKENDEYIHYEETFTTTEYSALVIRFYTKDQYKDEIFYSYLPSLSQQKIYDFDTISKNSTSLSQTLQKKISSQDNHITSESLQNHFFFKPDRKKLNNLFANANAEYLIAFPKTSLLSIRIKTENFSKKDFRFIGFMASNYKTTATDNSVSLEKGNTEYRIWVCYYKNVMKLKNTDYNPLTDLVLCWKDNNTNPILVYREVRIKRKGLQLLDEETGPEELRKIMKYPEIEYY